jgi:hypothetical protein
MQSRMGQEEGAVAVVTNGVPGLAHDLTRKLHDIEMIAFGAI